MSTAAPKKQLSVAEQVKADFAAYWGDAAKGRLADPADKAAFANQRALIASAHKYAMCFSYLSRAMTAQSVPLRLHQRIFIQELASDAVHLVHTLTGGDARGARFYLRSVIENFWQHHYYRDHVVEYGWIDTRTKFFLEMKELREHCSWLPCFQYELKPILTALPSLYSELSRSVHSTSSKTMLLKQTLAEIRLVESQVAAMKKDLLDTFKACLALCIFSERSVFLGLGLEVQDYLMAALSANHKRAVSAALKRVEAEPADDQ